MTEQFSLWRLAGRKSLFAAGAGLRLIVRIRSEEIQVRLRGQLSDGDRFAYQIPAGGDDRAAWAGLTAFRALTPVIGEPLERPGRTDLFHVRALQVLDGLAAGASQRELAVAIFGGAAVARSWQPDSALRAQMRYIIRRARALRDGEYRKLLATPPPLRRSSTMVKVRSRAASHRE